MRPPPAFVRYSASSGIMGWIVLLPAVPRLELSLRRHDPTRRFSLLLHDLPAHGDTLIKLVADDDELDENICRRPLTLNDV